MIILEIWKEILGFEGYYQARNFGDVRRIGNYSNQNKSWSLSKPKVLVPKDNGKGYKTLTLSVNGVHYYRYVHRLVALTFLENPNHYREINHKDGDKGNNCVWNLEWCNRSYNGKHAYDTGLRTVKGCYGRKKPVAQINKATNEVLKIFESVEMASKSVGLQNFCNISACCSYAENHSRYKRPCLSARGYKWRFATPDMKVGDIIKEKT